VGTRIDACGHNAYLQQQHEKKNFFLKRQRQRQKENAKEKEQEKEKGKKETEKQNEK